MDTLTQKETKLLIQFVWDSINIDDEKIRIHGIVSKDWIQNEIDSKKILLEKLIEFEKSFKQRRQ
jgi:hypothetical protein